MRRLTQRLSWQQTFAALRHRNYRLWFIGQLVSLIGTYMQATAQGFLVSMFVWFRVPQLQTS